MSFPKLKLSYFDFPGRAGAIRMAFFLGGIPFEDHRFPRQDLAAFKPECPYGAVPILQVNDEVLAESQAIARYAGRLAGLYPVNNPSAALLMDEAMYAVDEFGERFRTWWAASSDEIKKAEEAKLLGTIIPESFKFIDGILEKTSQHPTLKDSSRLFIHEIWVHQFLATFLRAGFLPFVPANVVDGYKHWEACVAKVDAHPRIQEWLALEQLRANQVKLVSCPFNGRENAIRLALDIGGVKFEDDRVESRDAFSKQFPTVPPIHSTMLEVNGQSVATQPLAVLIYVGKLSGLYPVNDPLAVLRVDEVFGVLEAFYSAVLPALTETDADAKRTREESLAKGDITKHLGGLDSRIKKRGQLYATGASLTVADLAIHGAVSFLQSKMMAHVPATIADEFPTLLSIHDRVATLAAPKP